MATARKPRLHEAIGLIQTQVINVRRRNDKTSQAQGLQPLGLKTLFVPEPR